MRRTSHGWQELPLRHAEAGDTATPVAPKIRPFSKGGCLRPSVHRPAPALAQNAVDAIPEGLIDDCVLFAGIGQF